MLTPEGDFDRGHRRLYDAYAYRNATLVYGAHMARQFDLSSRGLAFILAMQDEPSGGFPNDRAPDGTLGDVMDLPYTCGCGLACLALGRLDEARRVYRFLERVWSAQSELPERLYYSFSRRRQAVITEYDDSDIFLARRRVAGTAGAALDGRRAGGGVPLPAVHGRLKSRLRVAGAGVSAVLHPEHPTPIRLPASL